jgi:hypothetical protein
MVVTKDGWAFQVTGGFNEISDSTSLYSETENTQKGLELVRAAKQFGPLSLGAELKVSQSTSTNPDSTPVTDVFSFTALNLGAVYSIALGTVDAPFFLRPGAAFSFYLFPDQQSDNSSFSGGGGTVQQTYTFTSTANIFQPSLLLDIPGTFQGGILLDIFNGTTTEGYTTSDPAQYPNQPAYVDGLVYDMFGAAFYKWKIPLSSPGDPHPLTLNQGVFLETLGYNAAGLNTAGVTTITHPASGTRYQAGLGLERAGDFTVGFQVDGFPYHVELQYPGGSPVQTYNYPVFHATLGGEIGVSPHWALRAGLTYVDEQAIPTPLFNYVEAFDFFNVYAGEELTGILTSAGIGYQDKDLKVDAMGWFEQPQSTGTGFTGPDYAYTVFGGQVSLAWLLNL